MIAITFALPAESSGLLRRLNSKHTTVADGITIVNGELDGRKVAIFHTGAGRDRCQRNMQAGLGAIRPRLLISSGFAGGLTDRLGVADLIVAQNFSDWRLATQLIESSPPQSPQLPGLQPVILFTSNRIVESPEERQQIAQQHRADAIDMETEVIATACAVERVPMVSLRVISDTPAAPFPTPANILFDMARQRPNFGRLISYLLAHPSAVSRLIRFARQISRARARLTDALSEIVPRL